MSLLQRVAEATTVLGVAANSAFLTRSILLDRPVYLAVISAVSLTGCLIMTLWLTLTRR